MEQYKYFICPALERLYGRKYETNSQIFDLTGGGLTKFTSRGMINLIKLSSKVTQDYYPETMGVTYVVNAPFSFRAVWAIIKGFLDERTR